MIRPFSTATVYASPGVGKLSTFDLAIVGSFTIAMEIRAVATGTLEISKTNPLRDQQARFASFIVINVGPP